MKLRKQFTGKVIKSKKLAKKKPGVSMTLPDQALTISTLLERHSRGLPLGVVSKQGEYFDTEIPKFDDLTDVIKHKEELIEKEKQYAKEVQQVKSKAKAKKQVPKVDVQQTTVPKEVDDIVTGTE